MDCLGPASLATAPARQQASVSDAHSAGLLWGAWVDGLPHRRGQDLTQSHVSFPTSPPDQLCSAPEGRTSPSDV